MTRPATIVLLAALACSAFPAAAGPKERLAEMSPADRQAAIAERMPVVAEALAACDAGNWKNIPWETEPSSALAAAGNSGRPLLVFVYKTLTGDTPAAGELEGDGLACLGGRHHPRPRLLRPRRRRPDRQRVRGAPGRHQRQRPPRAAASAHAAA